MRKNYAITLLAILGAALAGWVNLAAQEEKKAPAPAAPTGKAIGKEAESPNEVKRERPVVFQGPNAQEAAALDAKKAERPPQPSAPVTAPAAEQEPMAAVIANDGVQERHDAGVSLRWIGPTLVRVGRPTDYSIMVRNTCGAPLQQVLVRVRIPAGITVTATEPIAHVESNLLIWDLGTLLASQERSLQMRVLPDSKGPLNCQAWVTFTGAAAMAIRICEPKLQLKATATEKVMVGDTTTIALTVANTGDGPAEQVKVAARISDGLEHPRGKNMTFDLGTLAQGEVRSVQLLCTARTGGEQKCEAVAVAEGDLKAQDAVSVNAVKANLNLEVAGPKLRYLERSATYSVKVVNSGDAPAGNVTINTIIPAGFKFQTASDGGRHDSAAHAVSWFIGEVGPGQAKEVKLVGTAVATGDLRYPVSIQADRGIRLDGEVLTHVEGLSNLVVKVKDTEDPIEVGSETSYLITVSNMGSRTETDLKLTCSVADKMLVKGAQGPSAFHAEGREIVFEPLAKLEPRGEVTYQVTVKSMTPGDARLKVQITGTTLTEPVIETESTRIYQD